MEKFTFSNNININPNIGIDKRKRNVSMDLNLANIKTQQYFNFNIYDKKNSYVNSSIGKNLNSKTDAYNVRPIMSNFNSSTMLGGLQIQKLNSPKKAPQSVRRDYNKIEFVNDKIIERTNYSKFVDKSFPRKLNSFNNLNYIVQKPSIENKPRIENDVSRKKSSPSPRNKNKIIPKSISSKDVCSIFEDEK